jgi:large subunit ribosomal protein L10
MKTTGFSRVSKELIIAEIEKEIKKSPTFFVMRHDSVPAANIDKLRAKLRATQTRYLVVKNTLGQKAFERAKLKDVSAAILGACGLAFTGGDPALSSKALMEFAKENESFKVQAGYLNGRLVGADEVKTLAMLPSRDVMLARVVGTIQAPISGFVSVLAGTLRKVVTALDAIAKKKSQN